MIKLDKQTELDAQYGSNSKDAKRERRLRKENRKRCVVYKDWLAQYKSDDSTDKKQFFPTSIWEYVDYQQLRRIQPEVVVCASRRSCFGILREKSIATSFRIFVVDPR